MKKILIMLTLTAMLTITGYLGNVAFADPTEISSRKNIDTEFDLNTKSAVTISSLDYYDATTDLMFAEVTYTPKSGFAGDELSMHISYQGVTYDNDVYLSGFLYDNSGDLYDSCLHEWTRCNINDTLKGRILQNPKETSTTFMSYDYTSQYMNMWRVYGK